MASECNALTGRALLLSKSLVISITESLWPVRSLCGPGAGCARRGDRHGRQHHSVVRQRCRGPPAGRDRETASGHWTTNSHNALA